MTRFELNSIAMQHIVILGVVLGYVKQYNAIHIYFFIHPFFFIKTKKFVVLSIFVRFSSFWAFFGVPGYDNISFMGASGKNLAFSLSKPKNA